MRRLVVVPVVFACACSGEPVRADAASGTGGATTTGTSEAGATGPVDEGVADECAALVPIAEDEFAARFAAAVCGQKATCGCDLDPRCVDVFTRQFEAVRRYARATAPHYDAACAAAVLHDAVDVRGCARKSHYYAGQSCQIGCDVFRGDVPPGGACGETPALDSAAFINVCADAGQACGILGTPTCDSLDAVPTVGRGEECLSADYETLSDCEQGLWCNYASRVCVPEVAVGQPCGDFAECSAVAWCDGTCQPAKADGAPCDNDVECTSLVCEGRACDDFVVACRVDSPSDLLYPFTL